MQQKLVNNFAAVYAKEINPKKVSWEDIVAGGWLSIAPGKSGQMVKSVATICGMDAMSLSTEQLCIIYTLLRLTRYHSKPKIELLGASLVLEKSSSFVHSN
jgi:hypothetical protein